MVGLLTDNDESAYREEVPTLTNWCHNNNLSLNISKTKVLVVDFRRRTSEPPPPTPSPLTGLQWSMSGASSSSASTLLRTLNWTTQTDSSEEGPPASLLPQATEEIWSELNIFRQFYSCTVESILTGCITAWYENCIALNRKALKRIVQTAQHISWR